MLHAGRANVVGLIYPVLLLYGIVIKQDRAFAELSIRLALVFACLLQEAAIDQPILGRWVSIRFRFCYHAIEAVALALLLVGFI